MALTMATQISDDVVIFRCVGRIVVGDEGAVFRERVRSILIGTPKIVIDLCSVDYIDSGGLGILVGLLISAKNRGGDIKLVSPSQRVQHVLGHTKLNTIFSIYKTLDKALAAFSGRVAWYPLLNSDSRKKQTRELLGKPNISMTEAAQNVGRAIGKPDLRYAQAPDQQVRAALVQLGMSSNMADLILEMSAALNSGRALEPRSVQNTTPTSYETFVAEEFLPLYEAKSAAA